MLPPLLERTLGVANASSFRAIAASIAALMRADPMSAAFLFRAFCGVSPVSPRARA
jgi:hypothetical protein